MLNTEIPSEYLKQDNRYSMPSDSAPQINQQQNDPGIYTNSAWNPTELLIVKYP